MVTEGKSGTVRDMIEKHGLYDTIRLVGSYGRVKRLMGDTVISREEKIKFIKERLNELAIKEGQELDDGLWFQDINIDKFIYDKGEDDYSLMELANSHYVTMYLYREGSGGQDIGSFREYYEDLPQDILDKLFNLLTE